MTLHWSWGLSTALLLALVIWLNGRRKRIGWLLGAAVQFINMGFGLAYGQWTFAFLAIPAVRFLINYFQHDKETSMTTSDDDDKGWEQKNKEAADKERENEEKMRKANEKGE